jgi:hypothetical protein
VNANSAATNPTQRKPPLSYFASSPSIAGPGSPDIERVRNAGPTDELANAPRDITIHGETAVDNGSSRPISISRQPIADPERQPLKKDFGAHDRQAGLPRYGSIVGSPSSAPDWGKPKRNPIRFELPASALQLPNQHGLEAGFNRKPSPLANTDEGNASEGGDHKYSPSRAGPTGKHASLFQFPANKVNPTSAEPDSYPSIKRLMSLGGNILPSSGSLPFEAYRELDARQTEVFEFLNSELGKIESFYKMKEGQATERLEIIREQLHVMRDCHIDELVKARTNSLRASSEGRLLLEEESHGSRSWLYAMDSALESARHASFGKRSMGMEDHPSHQVSSATDLNRDYVRHSAAHEIPYRTAKFKLKAAMQEFYRGLELLKSYALLNRKAFRKMNKKFDKAADQPPTLRYMSDKVNEAYFVKSHVLGNHIRAVEDLYARYFEGGNYKVATSKLRATFTTSKDYNGVVFRNGLMAATGVWFGIAGLNSAYQLLYHPNPTLAVNTSFLLQVSTIILTPKPF